jgi:hypothetical protein
MTTNRHHFTQHGFHLNKLGREWLAKTMASQIVQTVNTQNTEGISIPLKMNNSSKFSSKSIEYSLENYVVEPQTTTAQIQMEQEKRIRLQANCRTSTRVKKHQLPCPMTFYGRHKQLHRKESI